LAELEIIGPSLLIPAIDLWEENSTGQESAGKARYSKQKSNSISEPLPDPCRGGLYQRL
jgi:hypothetical protein